MLLDCVLLSWPAMIPLLPPLLVPIRLDFLNEKYLLAIGANAVIQPYVGEDVGFIEVTSGEINRTPTRNGYVSAFTKLPSRVIRRCLGVFNFDKLAVRV